MTHSLAWSDFDKRLVPDLTAPHHPQDELFRYRLPDRAGGYNFRILIYVSTNFHRIISRDARVVNGLDLNSSFSHLMASASQVRILFTTIAYCYDRSFFLHGGGAGGGRGGDGGGCR